MHFHRSSHVLTAALCFALPFFVPSRAVSLTGNTGMQQHASAALTPIPQQQLQSLLPATVYFRGKSAPLQLRNAGGVNFGGDALVLAAVVDTSGYASSIQDVYQIYVLTETPLTIGGHRLPAGAYGAGIVSGTFTVLDIGNHPVLQAPAIQDSAMTRPRPLQLLPDGPSAVKLYLGRNWVRIEKAGT